MSNEGWSERKRSAWTEVLRGFGIDSTSVFETIITAVVGSILLLVVAAIVDYFGLRNILVVTCWAMVALK